MSADPLTRFSDRVADYVRYRPTYPPAFYDMLRRELGVSRASSIADVGSGPGISAEPLLDLGATVYCVEPNKEMRQAADQALRGHPGFRGIAGTAEQTTLPQGSVDLILCAQAFHWFDRPRARAEFSRILKPGGHVVLVWNERLLDATPFLREYEALLRQFGTDYQNVRHENVGPAALAEFFATTGFRTFTFDTHQDFDGPGLEGRVRSSSYTPPPADPRFAPMAAALRNLFARHQRHDRVRFEYLTRAHVGRLD